MLKKIKVKNHGDMGIGTMIIFIAMVLVSAISASVLITTAGGLRNMARDIGGGAVKRVSAGVIVENILGDRESTDANEGIKKIFIDVSLTQGSPALDLSELQIKITDMVSAVRLLTYDSAAGIHTYSAVAIRDEDQSFTLENPVMSRSDIVKVTVDCELAIKEISTSAQIQMWFFPGAGENTIITFSTPSNYGSDRYIRLYN